MTPFLIISLPRSGSTWLATSLGQICRCDYEMKMPGRVSEPGLHVELAGPASAVLAGRGLDGSKLVFDMGEVIDFEWLHGVVDVPVVVLRRPFEDVLRSYVGHGCTHLWTGHGEGRLVDAVKRSPAPGGCFWEPGWSPAYLEWMDWAVENIPEGYQIWYEGLDRRADVDGLADFLGLGAEALWTALHVTPVTRRIGSISP